MVYETIGFVYNTFRVNVCFQFLECVRLSYQPAYLGDIKQIVRIFYALM